MRSSSAICAATRLSSPVSITVWAIPARWSASIAFFAFGLSTSAISICPLYSPSIATWTTVPTLWHSWHATPIFLINLLLPTAIFLPSTTAIMPLPPISSTSVTLLWSILPWYALHKLLLIGCVEWHSACAAYSNNFCSSSLLWCTPITSKTPCVIVPVLSNTTHFTPANVSK